MKRLKGMQDIFYPESEYFRVVAGKASEIFHNFGFSEILTPILEQLALFKRSVGEDTDVVSKEMYSFEDRNGEYICLRPENTASVVRAYIENNMSDKGGKVKLFYFGPMFRRERPQRGRYRQFYQLGAEIIGSEHPSIDAELLMMLQIFFKSFGIDGLFTEINSIGCAKCRPSYKAELIKFLNEKNDLCEDCKIRKEKNPLRVLDCKQKRCAEIVELAPFPIEFLCEDCSNHYRLLKEYMKTLSIPYIENKHLVRGLDYYTKTVFEIKSDMLGAQNTVCAGGRYDDLIKNFGGQATPAIGFSAGVERLVLILKELKLLSFDEIVRPHLFVSALGTKAQNMIFPKIFFLREKGLKVETDFSKTNLKKLMKVSDKLNSKFTLIIGDDEMVAGKCLLRNMETKTQYEIDIKSIETAIYKIIKKEE